MADVARELLNSARAAMYVNDYDRAIYLCKQVIERDPKFIDGHELLTEIQDALINDKLCAAHDAADAGDRAQARRLCDEVLQDYPENGDALFVRAFYQESREEANADMERVAALLPSDPAGLSNRAKALDWLSRYDEADAVWTQLVNEYPEDAELWRERAQSRVWGDRAAEALPDLRQALRLEPESADAFATLAQAELSLGYFESALTNIARARQNGYKGTTLDVVEAEAFYFLGRYAEAEARLAPLFAEEWIDPSDIITFACVLTQLDREAEAVKVLDTRVRPEDRYDDWYSARGQALLRTGNLAAGREHLDKDLELSRAELGKGTVGANYRLAWCLAHRVLMADHFDLAGVDRDQETLEAITLLKQSIAEDASNLRFAKAASEFDGLWGHPELAGLT